MKRYSAKLLFQFRVTVDADPGKRRICEERIVLIEAASARAALTSAKRKGRKAQFRYQNGDGNPVSFDFVGVMELLPLGTECDSDEVWYDIVERILPSERKSALIPSESELNAIRNDRQRQRKRASRFKSA